MFRSDLGGAGADLVGDGGGDLACQRGGKGLHRVRNPCGVAKPALSLRDAGGDRLTAWRIAVRGGVRSEEHTSELQSLMRISYAVFCLKKKINNIMLIVLSPFFD